VASKLLGSFSIREKGVGGYEQLDALGSDLTFTSLTGPPQTRSSPEIRPKKKRPPKPKENPLSSSIQENFKGFSYFGESLANNNMLAANAHRELRAETAYDLTNRRFNRTTEEEEFEDDSRIAGRYKIKDGDMEMD